MLNLNILCDKWHANNTNVKREKANHRATERDGKGKRTNKRMEGKKREANQHEIKKKFWEREMSLSFHLFTAAKGTFKIVVTRTTLHGLLLLAMCVCVCAFCEQFHSSCALRLCAKYVMYLHYKYVVNDMVNMQRVKWMSGRYENKHIQQRTLTPRRPLRPRT